MAPLIAPGIIRYTLDLNPGGGGPGAIIWDVDVETSIGSPTREETAFDTAGRIINAFVDNLLPLMVEESSLRAVRWVDLNDENGSTGERTSTSEHTLPVNGSVATAAMPTNVSMLIHKQVDRRRGFRRGRTYLPGMAESYTADGAPNTLVTATIDAFTAAWAAFHTEVDVGAAPSVADVNSVVVHTTTDTTVEPPLVEYVGHSTIRSLVVDPILATQRRRLR